MGVVVVVEVDATPSMSSAQGAEPASVAPDCSGGGGGCRCCEGGWVGRWEACACCCCCGCCCGWCCCGCRCGCCCCGCCCICCCCSCCCGCFAALRAW